MLRHRTSWCAAIAAIGFGLAGYALAGDNPAAREGYLLVKKEGNRKIVGKITERKDGRVEIELGKGSSTDFSKDEVTIVYTEGAADPAAAAGDPTAKKRVVEVEKVNGGGTLRGEVVDQTATTITIKPKTQGPQQFKLSDVKVREIEEADTGDGELGERYIDYEARFQLERPNADWRIKKSTSPETRVLMVLTGKDAFLSVSVKPAAANSSTLYDNPTKESAPKAQSDVEVDAKAELERPGGIQISVGELFGAPVVEARYDGKYPSETTEYQFIEQRFARDGLVFSLKVAAEKKTLFKELEPKLREAFTSFSFLAPQGGDDVGYNDLLVGFGIERPTEKWTVDARPFDTKEPVVIRAEDGKTEVKVTVRPAAPGEAPATIAADYLKGTDVRTDFKSEQSNARRGATSVISYHCTYFEGKRVDKSDEQGVIAVIEGNVVHAIGFAPFAGPTAKLLQGEVAKALESFKVFDPKRKRLADGAKAVDEYGKGVEAYKKKQYAEAIGYLNKAIDLYPDYARAYLYRATCQVEQKGWKEYRDDIAKAQDLDGRPEMQLRAAQLYLVEANGRKNEKQWAEGCKAFKEALRANPKDDKARKDFIRFYQDWWTSLKQANPGVKAAQAIDELEDYKWTDSDFNPIFAGFCVEAGQAVLQGDKKQHQKARSLASKALSYDKSNKNATALQNQCDDTKKQLEKESKPKGK